MEFSTGLPRPDAGSPEMLVLAFLVLLCLAVLGAMAWRWSGRGRSDVSGLRLARRDRRPTS